MSRDLTIWCTRPLQTPFGLPDAEQWDASGSCWVRDAGNWLLASGPSDPVSPEDVPAEVTRVLPGVRHVVYLSLEPAAAPESGKIALASTAREIARLTRGAILDLDADSVEVLPEEEYEQTTHTARTGALRAALARLEHIGRLLRSLLASRGQAQAPSPPDASPAGPQARISLLTMSWWFERETLMRREGIERILDLLKTHVPEAWPERYGLIEPPPYVLEKKGIAHFVGFLAEHLSDSIVWHTQWPVAGVTVQIRHQCGWQDGASGPEYRCNYFSLQVDSEALEQSGWQVVLKRLWRLLSIELRPFFGEVRTLHGYLKAGDRVRIDAETEPSPTRGGWWQGIPHSLGHAAVLGPPYLDLWPTFRDRTAPHTEGLGFISTPDWTREEDAAPLVGGVPPPLALPSMPRAMRTRTGTFETVYSQTYPPVFPFRAVPDPSQDSPFIAPLDSPPSED